MEYLPVDYCSNVVWLVFPKVDGQGSADVERWLSWLLNNSLWLFTACFSAFRKDYIYPRTLLQ